MVFWDWVNRQNTAKQKLSEILGVKHMPLVVLMNYNMRYSHLLMNYAMMYPYLIPTREAHFITSLCKRH